MQTVFVNQPQSHVPRRNPLGWRVRPAPRCA